MRSFDSILRHTPKWPRVNINMLSKERCLCPLTVLPTAMMYLSPLRSHSSLHLQVPVVELNDRREIRKRSRSPSRERDIADSHPSQYLGAAELCNDTSAVPTSSVAQPEVAVVAQHNVAEPDTTAEYEAMAPYQLSVWRYSRELM